MRRLVVIGAGGHAKVVIETARAAGMEVQAILDDDDLRWGGSVLGCPILGGLPLVADFAEDLFVIAIGSNAARRKIAASLDLDWCSVIHPSAQISPSAHIGLGSMIFANAVIQAESVLGGHVIVNTAASIDHDCRIGSFAHIAPGARLAGSVTVGSGALIGIGAVVIPGVTVGENAAVGAGAAVVRDVAAGSTVLGVPAVKK